jgi:hypothetical protein
VDRASSTALTLATTAYMGMPQHLRIGMKNSGPGIALGMRIGHWAGGSFSESPTLQIPPTIPSGETIELNLPKEEMSTDGIAIEYNSVQGSTLRSRITLEGNKVSMTALPEEHLYDDLFS